LFLHQIKCITAFLQMLCWFTSLLFGLCPLQNTTKLRLENSRQTFSPTKNSLQNLTYFQNVISNPEVYWSSSRTGSKSIHLTLRSDLFVWNVISNPDYDDWTRFHVLAFWSTPRRVVFTRKLCNTRSKLMNILFHLLKTILNFFNFRHVSQAANKLKKYV
jgi:hypothetical protein